MKNHSNQKLEAVTFKTLVVGVDIAKHNQWARFVDCRGIEHDKAIKFENNRNGFNAILTRIYKICKDEDFGGTGLGLPLSRKQVEAHLIQMIRGLKISVSPSILYLFIATGEILWNKWSKNYFAN